jgi:hypothetical protein
MASLYFDADKSPGKRSPPVRGGGHFLGRSRHEFCCKRKRSGYITGKNSTSTRSCRFGCDSK